MSHEEEQRDNSLEVERLILLKLCEARELEVPDHVAKDVDSLKELLGIIVLPAVEKPQQLSFEEQILRIFASTGQINRVIYDKVLEELQNGSQTSLGDALHESGAVTPELAATLNDGKALVDGKLVTIAQFLVALFDHQTANVSINESLTKRGWLKE